MARGHRCSAGTSLPPCSFAVPGATKWATMTMRQPRTLPCRSRRCWKPRPLRQARVVSRARAVFDRRSDSFVRTARKLGLSHHLYLVVTVTSSEYGQLGPSPTESNLDLHLTLRCRHVLLSLTDQLPVPEKAKAQNRSGYNSQRTMLQCRRQCCVW